MIKTGQTIEASDLVLTVTAGESLSARDACYISTADGKAYKCDADDITKVDFVGFAQEAAALNTSVNLVHYGHLGGFTALTVNADYFLSGTAGAITATAPTRYVCVGRAVTTSILKILPRSNVQVFSATGTFTKPSWATFLFIELWGPGGSGAAAKGASYAAAGGGQGGEYRSMIMPAAFLDATETVTIGTAGASVTQTSNGATNGNPGTDSSFGAHLVARGGGSAATATTSDASNASGGGGASGGTTGFLGIKNENGASGGNASTVGTGSATAGGNTTYGGAGGGGAYSDGTSAASGGASGGTSTRGGNGGAGAASYDNAAGATASPGAERGGGGGGAAVKGTGNAVSGQGGEGFCRITII